MLHYDHHDRTGVKCLDVQRYMAGLVYLPSGAHPYPPEMRSAVLLALHSDIQRRTIFRDRRSPDVSPSVKIPSVSFSSSAPQGTIPETYEEDDEVL